MGWALSGDAFENGVKIGQAVEAAGLGDFQYADIGGFQLLGRVGNPHFNDIFFGTNAVAFPEQLAEVGFIDMQNIGQRGQGNGFIIMLMDILQHLIHAGRRTGFAAG